MQTLVQRSIYRGERNARLNLAHALGLPFKEVEMAGIAPTRQHLLIMGSGDTLVESALRNPAFKLFIASIYPQERELAHFDLIIGPPAPFLLGNPRHLAIEGVIPSLNAQERARIAAAPEPGHVALLLGGNTLMVKAYGAAFAQALRQPLLHALQPRQRLFILPSPRTPEAVLAHIAKWQDPRIHLCAPGRAQYIDALARAEILLTTADSMLMTTEACMSGKPVYTLMPPGLAEAPHYAFCRMLVDAGRIRPFAGSFASWPPPPYPDPLEAALTRTRRELASRLQPGGGETGF